MKASKTQLKASESEKYSIKSTRLLSSPKTPSKTKSDSKTALKTDVRIRAFRKNLGQIKLHSGERLCEIRLISMFRRSD